MASMKKPLRGGAISNGVINRETNSSVKEGLQSVKG